jgi:DNA-binding transcriptional LysR family regulator
MPRALPPLAALLAFEATARHQSFTRAATELKLTQTAISHRIKELESLLSVQLFTRKQNASASGRRWRRSRRRRKACPRCTTTASPSPA